MEETVKVSLSQKTWKELLKIAKNYDLPVEKVTEYIIEYGLKERREFMKWQRKIFKGSIIDRIFRR